MQSQHDDVTLGALTTLVQVLRHPIQSKLKLQYNIATRSVDKIATTGYSHEPCRDLLTYFLVLIDKLAGGDGRYDRLLDGTSSLYDERHLSIPKTSPWVSIVKNEGYVYFAFGHYVNKDGEHTKLRVPLHHLTCYLRWGGAGTSGTHIALHDVACPHRHCLSPGCLRWGDPFENVQDRVARRVYLSSVLAREGQGAARTSEAPPLMPCSVTLLGITKGVCLGCGKGRARLPLLPRADILYLLATCVSS